MATVGFKGLIGQVVDTVFDATDMSFFVSLLTLKALADTANDVHGTANNSLLSTDLRQRPGLQTIVMGQVRQTGIGWSKGC